MAPRAYYERALSRSPYVATPDKVKGAVVGTLNTTVVMITGAESGIGRAMAERCALEGAAVAIAGIQADLGDTVASGIRERGGRAISMNVDVRDQAQIDAGIDQAVEAFGALTAVIANAGVSMPLTPFTAFSRQDWDRIVETNLTGVFLTLQAAAQHLVGAGNGGSLIATGSSTAIRPGIGRIAYIAAKAGVHNMVRALALELAPHNIRVNGIAPGLTETPLTRSKPGYIQKGLEIVPLGEPVQPDELGALAAFMLSDDARHMTGSIVSLDAGRTCD
jgi:NAD(P)-dependent dehydrogenase (short-subunit alcohol dehydrogenase family)